VLQTVAPALQAVKAAGGYEKTTLPGNAVKSGAEGRDLSR